MRYIRYGFLASLGIILITVALANRANVALNILPTELSGFLGWGWSVELPLFVVIFASVIAGILIGFIWEWLREYKQRAGGNRAQKELDKLTREVDKFRNTSKPAKGDDVVALIDNDAH